MAAQLALQRNFVTITPSNQISSTTTQTSQSTTSAMATTATNGDIVTITDTNQISPSETNSAPIHIMQTHTQVRNKWIKWIILVKSLIPLWLAKSTSIFINPTKKNKSISFRKNISYKRVPHRMVFQLLTLYRSIKPILRMKHQLLYQPFCRPIPLPLHQVALIRNKLPHKLPSFKLRKHLRSLNKNHISSLSMVSKIFFLYCIQIT